MNNFHEIHNREASTQTVYTSAHEKEVLRTCLRLQSRVRYLESLCSEQQKGQKQEYNTTSSQGFISPPS
ncbi:hypothetical protein LSM04_006579 [Trypanosoma melophagium]|uniref:uncharacterized protein n=1 Tax=Trypanosoma melophagium TaxID=715481 RepID=UPI00351A2C39|nr:hypothetical protein LSM04_006579 [Trypanosoma melophagium]